jgi:hypothetical protein
LVYAKGKKGEKFNLALVDFIIELKKSKKEDLFTDKLTGSKPHPFVASKNTTLGQLIVYATIILGSQYCIHAFMVFIFSHYARLI